MKMIKFFGVFVLASLIFSCANEKKVSKEDLKTEVDSVSYAIGMDIARNVVVSFEDINNDLFIEGYLNALDSTDVWLEDEEAQKMVRDYFTKNREKIAQKQQEIALKKAEKEYAEGKLASEKFLEDNKSKEGVQTTASGLQYIVLKEGTGNMPTATDRVKVHYHGTLIDGTVFDSSVDRGEPTTFGVGQVIKGWTEGLQLMKEGAKYKFFIPQELAYGSTPRGGTIKPFDALVFEVELLEIIKPEQGK